MFSKSKVSKAKLYDLDESVDLETTFSNKFDTNNNELSASNYEFNGYDITTSFTDNSTIFIRIINPITFQTYEGIYTQNDIESSQPINKFYLMLTKCFESKPNYNLKITLDESSLYLNIYVQLDDIYEIKTQLSLNEKIINGDKLVTKKITEIESKYKKLIKDLEDKIDTLKIEIDTINSKPIIFGYDENDFSNTLEYSSKTELLDFTTTDIGELLWAGNYLDFNKLTNVKKIKLFSKQFTYESRLSSIKIKDTINSVRKREHCGGCYMFINIDNIFNHFEIYLPSVIEIEIIKSDLNSLPNSILRSLPNLKKVIFSDYQNTSLECFEFIKLNTQLKDIQFKNCSSIQLLDEIKNWCDSKNIKLNIR
jgi:hypothetical protein